MSHKVDFYLDYNSPYAYLGSKRIEAACAEHGAALCWVPIVLGGVFKARGFVPPVVSGDKTRNAYMQQDLTALSAIYGVPYRERTSFLFNPVPALRATLAVPDGPERARAVHAVFGLAFAQDGNPGDVAQLQSCLDKAGLDGKALLARTQEAAIKEELKQNTERAIEMGIFGVPTFIVDGKQMVWGQDRMDVLAHYLRQ